MKRIAFALAFASTGCHLVFALDDASEARDASVGSEGIGSGLCYGTTLKVCLAQPLLVTASIPEEIDTDNEASCLDLDPAGEVHVCAIGAKMVAVPLLRARGSRPIVILGDMVIAGTIDVSSGPGGAGAGARASCLVGSAPASGAGGAGGSHGERGGSGGMSDTGQGGIAVPARSTNVLDGGCPGQDSVLQSGTRAPGGAGGGAVAVIASEIMITGTINASGAGGAGGPPSNGGGAGGGAGGMVYLEAPMMNLDVGAQVFANGGGGGEGASVVAGARGQESAGATNLGLGGTGGIGGDGGAGGIGIQPAMMGATGTGGRGGGGGGGGVGVIRMLPDATGNDTNVSPPPTPP